MKKDFWDRLESRLLDIYQNNLGIRYLVTSSVGKFNFTHFHTDEDCQNLHKEQQDYKGAFRRTRTDAKIFEKHNKNRHSCRADIKLQKLKDHESVDLVLYHTRRVVNKDDFNSTEELERSIKKQMVLEKVITDCKGTPCLLIQVAKLLNKSHPLWRIEVKKDDDRL